MSEIWIIDHNTSTLEAKGRSNFLYRWGNPQAYNQGVDKNTLLTIYLLDIRMKKRKIMVFNNGLDRTPLYSESLIISPPVDSNGNYNYIPDTAFGPNESFKYPENAPSTDSEFYSAIVSKTVPNGNILICEGKRAIF